MILNRQKTRTILNTTETTSDTATLQSGELAFVLLTSDFFHVGFKGKFGARFFDMGTANTNAATLTLEYFDGTTFQPLIDVIDQTNGFTKSGFISWLNVEDWQKNEQIPITSPDGDDIELFYIRISTDTNFSAGTTLNAVINLFSDDEAIKPLYPELISDTRFLPPNRTDFLDQHLEAKNRVVRRLNQKGIIKDESQIINVNDVSEAAAHAFADIVLSPIATSEALITIRDDARRNFESELTRVNLGIDKNRDGKVSTTEERMDSGRLFRQ